MKIEVNMKTPDAVYYALEQTLASEEPTPEELEEYDDVEMWREGKTTELTTFLDKWFYAGEGLTIQFDTEAGTATVEEKQ